MGFDLAALDVIGLSLVSGGPAEAKRLPFFPSPMRIDRHGKRGRQSIPYERAATELKDSSGLTEQWGADHITREAWRQPPVVFVVVPE